MGDEPKKFDLHEFATKNKTLLLVVAVVLFLVVVYFLYKKNAAEKFTNFAIDMAAAENPDPTLFKYTGRIRAPSGLDEYDNLYENKMVYNQGYGPRLEGAAAFQPRVQPPFPAIVPSSVDGFRFAARDDIFRTGSLALAEARSQLQKEKGPDAIITRQEIEARALAAEDNAYALAVGDKSAEAPAKN